MGMYFTKEAKAGAPHEAEAFCALRRSRCLLPSELVLPQRHLT
jgi:hypothetical protein